MQDFWKTAMSFWLPWEADGAEHGAWGREQGVGATNGGEEDWMDWDEREELDDLDADPIAEVSIWGFEL